MPCWMEAFAKHQPVTAAVDAIRRCVLGGPTTSLVLQSPAWSIGIITVFVPLAIARYRRVV